MVGSLAAIRRSAGIRSQTHTSTSKSPSQSEMDEISRLTGQLLATVREVQARFGGSNPELATEMDHRVADVLASWEAVLSHGLQDSSRGWWPLVSAKVTRQEIERFSRLRHVKSETGRGRAWLRSALNERSLERTLLALLADPQLLAQHYSAVSLLRDNESVSLLPTVARGLSSLLFAFSVDKEGLDSPLRDETQDRELEAKTSLSATPVKDAEQQKSADKEKGKGKNVRRPRGPRVQVISFDNDYDGESCAASCPSTSSPVARATSGSLADSTGDEGEGREDAEDGEEGQQGESFEADERESREGETLLRPLDEISLRSASELEASSNHSVSVPIPIAASQTASSSQSRSRSATMTTNQQCARDDCQGCSRLASELEEWKSRAREDDSDRELEKARLQRENAALKEQLKRYISAVQLLRPAAAASNADEVSSASAESVATCRAASSARAYDAAREATEYERKLVQVAEMHGELVEFNDRLLKVIRMRDDAVRRLRAELVELRGSVESGDSEDESAVSLRWDSARSHHMTSHLSRSVPSCASPSPQGTNSATTEAANAAQLDSFGTQDTVHVWIPSAFLQQVGGERKSSSGGATGKRTTAHVYQIYVQVCDQEWNCYRRYSQFHALRGQLAERYPSLKTFPFPPKRTLSSRHAHTVQERRKGLEAFLRQAISVVMRDSPSPVMNKRSLLAVFPFLGERSRHYSGSSDGAGSRPRTGSVTQSAFYMGF